MDTQDILVSVFDIVEQYAPGFKASVVGRDILTPPDLERVFGLTGGVKYIIHIVFLVSIFLKIYKAQNYNQKNAINITAISFIAAPCISNRYASFELKIVSF